ncbi:phage integrase [Salmonella enterica subsp. enterica]|uniref:Phage integrase n=1 Tax=Salmonella enterica I TaxID=59201 RepID=A0A379VL39_SALET|nr:phage integrase [Salmonella enterica subsp. enterica]
MITKVCLATGARWSEAENLQGHQLSKYRITYTKTKGKKTEPYRYLRNCTMNSPKTEGSYSRHAEKPLNAQ